MPVHPPTRILFVHHRSEAGGAPTSLAYLIRELDRARFEPHVYCPGGAAAALFRAAGASVHTGPVAGFTHIWASTYDGRRWLLLGRELARLPRHLISFRRLLATGGFGLLHLNDSPPLPAAWLARRRGIPVVLHLRSALPHGGRDRRSRLLRRIVDRLSDATVAINADVAAIWATGAAVVPNSVDLARFHPGDARAARDELGLTGDRPVVTLFAFLYPSKGYAELIRSAALLRDRALPATYVVVGGGVRGDAFFSSPAGRLLGLLGLVRDHARDARALVAELALEPLVRFEGFTDRPELFYRASDVVVSPSQGPELGRPILEAAATGVPVVGTGSRTGGGTVLPGETGLLAAGPDAVSLAASLGELLADPARCRAMGLAARTHAERTFDPVRNARLVEAIYDRLRGTTAGAAS